MIWQGRAGSRMNQPPLKPLHADDSLSSAKLGKLRMKPTQQLIDSRKPDQKESLKTRPDGTMIDGHHRIKVLRERGIDVDSLPREIVLKDEEGNS